MRRFRLATTAVVAALALVLGMATAAAADDTTYLPLGSVGISGIPSVGFTITATTNNWPDGTTLSYSWVLDGVPTGRTGGSYSITEADALHSLVVAVTGHLDGYFDSTAYSYSMYINASLPTPGNPGTTYFTPSIRSVRPSVSGGTAIGDTVTASIGAWAPADVAITWQWTRDREPIAGATSPSHVITLDDLGTELNAVATGTKAGYTSATARSYGFTLPSVFATMDARVVGTALVGSSLSAITTGPALPDGTTLSYRWTGSGTASGSRYQPSLADVGTRIGVTITATWHNQSKSDSSDSLLVVPTLPQAPKAKIVGSASVGATLVAKPGTWAPSGMRFTYQWYAGNLPIKGATKAKLHLGGAHAGKRVVVRITGTSPGYRSLVTISKATKKVAR